MSEGDSVQQAADQFEQAMSNVNGKDVEEEDEEWVTCSGCDGSGHPYGNTCDVCGGTGGSFQPEPLEEDE